MAQVLRPLSATFQQSQHPQVLVGLAEPDDAAVYQIDAERAVISTMDFFPPVVDDPYDFGAIAAANALSDVYAMGGAPLMAINLVAWPEELDKGILAEILRGGAEKVREAGAVIAGGHSITDQEPKYGLSVTGAVEVGKIIRKSGARAGDKLILTKPIGTGIVTTAHKQGKVDDGHLEAAVGAMSRLNKAASELAREHGAHAMTDITGFGLGGHSLEMAKLSGVDFRIDFDQIALLPGAADYGARGIFPGGMGRNREYFSQWARLERELAADEEGRIYDPQTSGGLLIAIGRGRADALLDDLLAAGEGSFILGEAEAGAGRLRIV